MEEERENLNVKKAQKKLKKNLTEILHKRVKTNNFVSFIDLAINSTNISKEYKSFMSMNDESSKRLFEMCDVYSLKSGIFNRKLLCVFGLDKAGEMSSEEKEKVGLVSISEIEDEEDREDRGKVDVKEKIDGKMFVDGNNNKFNSIEANNFKNSENNLDLKINHEGVNYALSRCNQNKNSINVNPFISLNSLNSEVKKDDKIYDFNENLKQKNSSFFGSILNTKIGNKNYDLNSVKNNEKSVEEFGFFDREDYLKGDLIGENKYLNTRDKKITEQSRSLLREDLVGENKYLNTRDNKITEQIRSLSKESSICSPKQQDHLSKVSSNDHSSGFLSKFTFYDSSDMPESEDKFIEVKNIKQEIPENNKLGLISFINRSSDDKNSKLEKSNKDLELEKINFLNSGKNTIPLSPVSNFKANKSEAVNLQANFFPFNKDSGVLQNKEEGKDKPINFFGNIKNFTDDKKEEGKDKPTNFFGNIKNFTENKKKSENSFFDLLNSKKEENLSIKTELNFNGFKFEIGDLKNIIFKETPHFTFFYEDGKEIKY